MKNQVIALFSAILTGFILAAFVYWLIGVFYVDQQAVVEKLNLSKEGIVEYGGNLWRFNFESNKISKYEGKVRHISRNNERLAPMMTHDILVTSGDYADEQIVQTNVGNHHFTWRSRLQKPSGRINLIHAVPANTSIYNKIRDIRYGNNVVIEGYEISRITNLQDNIYWEDSGCNTLYITQVRIKE